MEKRLEMDAFDGLFFTEDESESDLSRALRVGDDKYLLDYAKQFESKKDNELFKILDMITIKRDKTFDVSTVKYNKFIIEEMLSRSPDCLHVVMTLNYIGDGLSNQQHYNYLVRNVPVGRKNYKDGVKKYLEISAKEMLVKVLLMEVYGCNIKVAKDYYDVLVSRNLVYEFITENKGFLITQEADNMVNKYMKNKDQKKLYDRLVGELVGGNFDRNKFGKWE